MGDVIAVVILALIVGVIGVFSYDLSNARWWRRHRGGHWEKWAPGFIRPYWWIQSPTGRCSTVSFHWSGRRRVECEDY